MADTIAQTEASTVHGGGALLANGRVIPWTGFDPRAGGAKRSDVLKYGALDDKKIYQPGAEMRFTADGFCELRETYHTEFPIDDDDNPTWALLADLPAKYDPHPRLPLLGVEDIVIQHIAPDSANVTLLYVGLASKNPWPPFEECITNTSQEPIETHPLFKQITGLPDNPKDFVILDDNNNFVGFDANAPEDLGGVTDWLVRNPIIRRSYAWPTRPASLQDVGRIFNLRDAPMDVPNWLMISKTWRRRGNAWAIAEDYMGSGRKGWNTLIYGT